MDPRNLTHGARSSQAWFIFNLNKEILSFTDRILQYLHIINARLTCPLLPATPLLLTWRTSLCARGGELPSTLVPGLLTTAPPFTSSPTPSHPTHRSSYKVYIDDINNTGGHQQHRSSSSGTVGHIPKFEVILLKICSAFKIIPTIFVTLY
jgi:hypothetical protein